MKWRWLVGSVILVGLLGIGVIVWRMTQTHQFSGLMKEPPEPAADFTLTDETGNPFTLSQLRGQWVLLYYGYTTCPDVCPATLAILAQAKRELGADGAKFRVVFITVDPERDTTEVMRRYLKNFGDDYKGLTGSAAQIANAAKPYGVKYEKVSTTSALGYLVNHSGSVYLIDPQWRWRETFPFGVQPDEVAADLKYLSRR
jgi:protein SCO1/2